MISDQVLDQILPVPEIDDLMKSTESALRAKGFPITNFNSGGIFYTLLMTVFRIRIELVQLLRGVLGNMFVSHAQGLWLELKAADYSKKRKAALKTQGFVTVSRTADGEAVTVPKGHVFKTAKDINGEELRFFVTSDATLQKGALSATVPVEAEIEGARYNVAVGQITRTLTYLDGIDAITNAAGWISREGCDIEDYESLRARVLNAWADVAAMPIAQKYKNICEAISGVLFARIDDQHPRGQGTIDIIITSTAGAASDTLLEQVRAAANEIKGPYDNLLVKSSTTAQTDVSATVSVPTGTNTEGLSDRIRATILQAMQISKDRKLNELLHSDLIYAVRRDISAATNVKITLPVDDLILAVDTVILPGTITVSVTEV